MFIDVFYWGILQAKVCFFSKKKIRGGAFCRILVVPCPKNYIIELNESEIRHLRSKLSTANLSPKVRAIPKAFTEKGLYMLATVLKSPRATDTTLAIIESFAHLRELSRNLNILSTETDEGKQKTLTQRSSELLHELLSVEEMGDTTETESSIELNLYALKMKRTVKKIKKG